MKNTRLTKRQVQVYRTIRDLIRAHGWPPTMQEIGATMGIGAASAWAHVQLISKKGYLRVGGGAREICILKHVKRDGRPAELTKAGRALR